MEKAARSQSRKVLLTCFVSSLMINDETKQQVKSFFETDDISRVMAGKRNPVPINEEGQTEIKQKCIMLMNLNEAHQKFENEYPCKSSKLMVTSWRCYH